MDDFGIIVICCDQDYSFAKGVCASVRYFLGDIPICLLVDGDFSVEDTQKAYGVKVINRRNVRHEVLKQRSFGWGITRMIAFWESPFKRFLIVDADVAIWGNVLKYANYKDYDLILDQPCYDYTYEMISHYFLNVPAMEKHFPDFQWRDRPFVCPAVVYGTRDIFPLEEYVEILDFMDHNPDVLRFGDMGFFNFMLFRAADQGRLRLGQANMQVLVPDFNRKLIERLYAMDVTGPAPGNAEAKVIHWCGPKPTMYTWKTYAAPMKFFRRKFLKDAHGKTGLAAEFTLWKEDIQRAILVYTRKLKKKFKKLLPVSAPLPSTKQPTLASSR